MTRRLQWGVPEAPAPKNPARSTMLVYGFMAAVIVVLAWVTGGSVGTAALVALGFWIVASAWTIWRFRERARREKDTEVP